MIPRPWVHALGAKDGAGVTGQEAVLAQGLPRTGAAVWVYKTLVTGNRRAGMPTLRLGPGLLAGALRGGGSPPRPMGIIS